MLYDAAAVPVGMTADWSNRGRKDESGSSETIQVDHSYTAEQIEWFQAGSALNMISAAQS